MMRFTTQTVTVEAVVEGANKTVILLFSETLTHTPKMTILRLPPLSPGDVKLKFTQFLHIIQLLEN